MHFPLFLAYRTVHDLPLDYQCVVFGRERIETWPDATAMVRLVSEPSRFVTIHFEHFGEIVSSYRYVDSAYQARLDNRERFQAAWQNCIGIQSATIKEHASEVMWASPVEQSLQVHQLSCDAKLAIRNPGEFQTGRTQSQPDRMMELNDHELMAGRGFQAGDRIPCYLTDGCGLLELLSCGDDPSSFHCNLHVCSDTSWTAPQSEKYFVHCDRPKGKLPRTLAQLTNASHSITIKV